VQKYQSHFGAGAFAEVGVGVHETGCFVGVTVDVLIAVGVQESSSPPLVFVFDDSSEVGVHVP
jgi:hypothetical protein